MIGDSATLLRAEATVARRQLARAPVEKLVGAVLVAVLAAWVVRVTLADVLGSLPDAELTAAVTLVTRVVALLIASTTFAYSMAFPTELTPFAHRVSGSVLMLKRATVATLPGLVIPLALISIVGVLPAPSRWVATLLAPIGQGVLIGLGVGVGAEVVARRLVPSRNVVAVSRIATAVATLAAAAGLVLYPTSAGWSALAAAVVVGMRLSRGTPPLRPAWLPRATRSADRSAAGRVATVPFLSPLTMLSRDPLCLPAAATLISLVALLGFGLRFPAGAQAGTVYQVAWPLLTIVPVCPLAVVAPAKASAAGGGLYGHRVGPLGVALAAMFGATAAAGAAVLGGGVLVSMTSGMVLAPAEFGRLLLVTVTVVATAFWFAALRPVKPDVADLPVGVSLALVIVVALQVTWALPQPFPRLLVITVVHAGLAVVALVIAARGRAPYTS